MFPVDQQNLLCHVRASQVVGVHTEEPVDDLDRVVTINQIGRHHQPDRGCSPRSEGIPGKEEWQSIKN
jgi:hypothetical protein